MISIIVSPDLDGGRRFYPAVKPLWGSVAFPGSDLLVGRPGKIVGPDDGHGRFISVMQPVL
jgi:hypothetical protein